MWGARAGIVPPSKPNWPWRIAVSAFRLPIALRMVQSACDQISPSACTSPTREAGYVLPSSSRLRQCGTDEVYDVESQSATHAGSGDPTTSVLCTTPGAVTSQEV